MPWGEQHLSVQLDQSLLTEELKLTRSWQRSNSQNSGYNWQEFKIPKIKIPKIKIPMIKIPKGGIKIPTEGSKYQWGYQNTNGGIKIPNRGYQNTKWKFIIPKISFGQGFKIPMIKIPMTWTKFHMAVFKIHGTTYIRDARIILSMSAARQFLFWSGLKNSTLLVHTDSVFLFRGPPLKSKLPAKCNL